MRKRSVVAALGILGTLTTAALLTVAGQASAEEKVVQKSGTVTLKVTTVVGTPTRPSVVIEIARAKPEIKLSNLQDPAVEKTVRAATKGPF